MASSRRLAAILAADVAGYSRLMGADEEGTLERLKALRREFVDPKIAEHQGRIVKTTGDGLLVEFASVVDALRCAAEIQKALAEGNAVLPPDRRIEFRIGIHQGDIIVEDGDIFGDGVNVAARLEGLAEPGGICVSARVREDAAGKLDLAFRDLGEQQLKNIERPVRAYAVGATVSPARSRPRRIGTTGLVAAPIILAVVGIGAAAWWAWPRLSPPATTAQAVPIINPGPVSEARAAPRLSIIVLPFANLSNDPEQQYFADGITEDLTTDLSRIADLFVISRNTAFTYRNKPVDTKQIGRELGVRYLLEGSVRRSGNQVRVSAQLIDAETDKHLWAERFDLDTGDLFTLQNEITTRIAVALNRELVGVEAARPTENPDALDYILRGRAAAMKGGGAREPAQAISLLERALTLDPRSVEAQSRLAGVLAVRAIIGRTDSAAADIARADELVGQALAASPRDWFAHWVKGQVLRAQGRCEEAIPEYETALALNRNGVVASIGLGWCKLLTGSIEEAIPLFEQAIRLSPRDPSIGFWYGSIGIVHLLQSRIDEAILWLEKARSALPGMPRADLASAYALRGETERAAAELAEARRLSGDNRYSSIADLKAAGLSGSGTWGVPKIRALFDATYIAGLRKAGMPEE
jgi:TolB-like protein/class 3 adenylate cyclase/Flp pilus assembly protein TadD